MVDLNMEAEHADFEAWADSKRILPHARAARWAGWEERARRAAPTLADDGLPPPDVHASGDMFGAPTAYSAAKVRDAIAADRAARAQQKAQTGGRGWIGSVGDYAQFHVLLNTVCNASEELEKAEGREVFAAADNLGKAKDSLIAYIDGRTAGAAPEVATPTCRNCLGFGWEPSISGERRPCAFCQDAAPSRQQGKEGA